ncbi:hypothetical protein BGZ54_008914 [Gamsiella multidivaricata]|nr:hypothetical protein BGZ54_008914 [Gamsiella multidivaricata]
MLAFPGPRSSAISRFVEETAWIHELNLTSLNLRESGVTTEQLVWLLQHSPKLRSIDIVGCRSLEQHPLQTLHPYTHLEAIAFTYDDPFPASGRYPENVLGSWPALRHLNLSGYVLSKDRAAFPVFLSENTSLLNLKSLELVQLPEWADRALTKLIGSGNQLSSLSLTGCNFTPQELIDLSPSLHSLSSLTIRICSQIKTEHCLSILQSLPRIRHLDLGGCFTSDWFEEFVRIMPHIVSLTLTCDEISSAGLKQVFMNCRALRCQIIYTSLGPNSITTLFGGEPWNCLHLQELRLSGSDWSPAGWKDRSGMMKIMWSRLATLKRLRVLVLQNDIGTHQLKNELGVTQLGNLPQLELLCLTGFGIWHYKDVWWIAESLPELDRFCYAPKEMSTPLWSWLRLNRPDVWIIPLKTDAALG